MNIHTRRFANLSLLLVTLIWGATFVVVKRAVEDLPPFPFLALRFSLAFVSLLPFAWRFRKDINRVSLFKGLALGSILFIGYASQTIGLQYTTASNAGFITGLAVVIVPIMVVISTGRFPRSNLVLGVVSATLGLALLSLGSTFLPNKGDLLVLVCAFSFATHIFLVGRYAPGDNALILTTAQLLAVAIWSSLFTLFTPTASFSFTSNVWIGILLTAIPATSLAYLIQTKMQQFTTPSDTALILTGEPVFSAFFAFLLAGEVLGLRGITGASLVLLGMLIAEFTNAAAQPSG